MSSIVRSFTTQVIESYLTKKNLNPNHNKVNLYNEAFKEALKNLPRKMVYSESELAVNLLEEIRSEAYDDIN